MDKPEELKITKVYTGNAATTYDHRHFGGASGRYVFQRDCSALVSLIGDTDGLLLDVPSGTGQYATFFAGRGLSVVAGDASEDMLRQNSRQQTGLSRVLCDIQYLPFADATFDITVTIRLFQHLQEDEFVRALTELKRVLKPGGVLVFDTFRWTPRHMRWIPKRFLGRSRQGEMHVYSHHTVQDMLGQVGIYRRASVSLYFFSPLLYRKLPLSAVRILSMAERLVPSSWLLRTFWACGKQS